jgi:hypothetical protein
MGSRSIGGSRVKKHAVSSDTKETTLRGQRPRQVKCQDRSSKERIFVQNWEKLCFE